MTELEMVFVYGTLRPGGALHDHYFRGAIRAGVATVPGDLHLVSGRGWYPVWLPDGEGVTFGDLLLVSRAAADRARCMEEGAGYETLRVTATAVDDLRAVEAMAFAWPSDRRCGPRIESGDWFTHTATRAAYSAS